jgi:hypothetical protein
MGISYEGGIFTLPWTRIACQIAHHKHSFVQIDSGERWLISSDNKAMASHNPYANQSSGHGRRAILQSNSFGNGTHREQSDGSRLQPASFYQHTAVLTHHAHPEALESLEYQQPRQQTDEQSDQQQHQSQQQLNMIAELRRKLAEKEEENFDLEASVSGIQAETTDRLQEAERESKQKISKLEEALRRAQQDANRLRASLKKKEQQQAQMQQQPVPVQSASNRGNAEVQQNQSPAKVQAQPAALSPAFQRATQAGLVAFGTDNQKPSSGSISPSPADAFRRQPESRAYDPMDCDEQSIPYFQSAGVMPKLSTSTLAQKLLQELTSDNSKGHMQVHFLLSQAMVGPQDALIWDLVQQSVDNSNHQALSLLQTALVWSPSCCQSLIAAAGWKVLDADTNENQHALSSRTTKTTIRFGDTQGTNKGKLSGQLAGIASNLKQPLALSRGTLVANTRLLTAPSPPQKAYTPKQELLARQLVEGLSEAIGPSRAKASDATLLFPHKVSLGIMDRVLSNCDGTVFQPSLRVLEPIMVGMVARLESHRQDFRPTLLFRGYDPLPLGVPRAIAVETEPHCDEKETGPTEGKPTIMVKEKAKPTGSKKAPPKFLDPMVCQVCRQIERLVPHFDSDRKDSDKDEIMIDAATILFSPPEFIHQWRKAVLANACDILEHSLLPFLLNVGGSQKDKNRNKINEGGPSSSPEVTLTMWQEWIPWFTTLVRHKGGRDLLRTQFPLLPAAVSSKKKSEEDGKSLGEVSCSAMGVVTQLLYASAMVEQCQAHEVSPSVLALVRTIQSQCIRCIHVWLQCHEARRGRGGLELSFLDLVSEFPEFYKSSCAWTLHQSDVGSSTVDPECVAMIKTQAIELVLDEEEYMNEREDLYKKKDATLVTRL